MGIATWSDYALAGLTVREAVEQSEHREAFMTDLAKFAAHAGPHEQVNVLWWWRPYLYVEVRDDRYHYPCSARACATFNLAEGEWSDRGAVFARKRWGTFMDRVYRYHVTRYKECAEPTRPAFCLIPTAA